MLKKVIQALKATVENPLKRYAVRSLMKDATARLAANGIDNVEVVIQEITDEDADRLQAIFDNLVALKPLAERVLERVTSIDEDAELEAIGEQIGEILGEALLENRDTDAGEPAEDEYVMVADELETLPPIGEPHGDGGVINDNDIAFAYQA